MAEGRSRSSARDDRLAEVCGLAESSIADIEEAVETEVREAVARALAVGRPRPPQKWPVHAEAALLADDAAAVAGPRGGASSRSRRVGRRHG